MAYQGGQFHWLDYLIFSLSCLMTIAVGGIFAFKDKWTSQSSESYLMADRDMSWFLVGMSSFASTLNAILFVGVSAEFYYMGWEFIWVILALVISSIITMVVTIPKFFRLGFTVTSAYQYLQVRFNLPVRMLAAIIFTFGTLIYMAVILYAPCIMLNQVSGFDIRAWIAIVGAVCILYTGFGGMKAVVWVDSLQVLVMLAGLIVLAVKGTYDAGGIHRVFEVYMSYGRDDIIDLDPRPWKRHSFLNIGLLYVVFAIAYWGSHQVVLQRYMTVRNMRRAQLSMVVGKAMIPVFVILIAVVAMAAFATLGGNDPLLNGEITKRSQLFSFYMMRCVGDIPGVPGLLVASSLAAALSTLSSGQNSLAAVFLEDFVKPIYKIRTGDTLSSARASYVSRISGVLLGFLLIGQCLAVSSVNDMVFSMSRSVMAFVTGPLFMLISVAMFVPFVESWGAFSGTICSLLFAIHMYIGALNLSNNIGQNRAPLYNNNFTVKVTYPDPDVTPNLYDVSYVWYVPLSIAIGTVVACVVSAGVNTFKHRDNRRERSGARWTDCYPADNLLYTVDDFLVAIGVRRSQQKPWVSSNGNKVCPSEERRHSENVDIEMMEKQANSCRSVTRHNIS